MKIWKQLAGIGLAFALAAGPLTAFAESAETEPETQDTQESGREGQLTLEDLSALNNGQEKVYTHNGRVTMVDGTCTDKQIRGFGDAAFVMADVLELIGADAGATFIPWRSITDPLGNNYYIFQQVYGDTTVCGGAIKVITDPEGNMIGLTSSVESAMPDVEPGESITAEEAERLVADRAYEVSGWKLEVQDQYTSKVVLPTVLKFDIENEDMSSRFVWVVYTNNPSGNVRTGSDLPYLAHYVTMDGEYLYSIPAITPDDEAGRSGYDYGYVFEFMEPAEYTGYVDLSDGTEKEISVTVMRDRRTGMYYLGNIERRIMVAQCYDFLYGDGQIVLESSTDNLEWDQIGLLSFYNYCRAYDYYKEIGWIGGDGEETPILVLNNFCDDHRNGVNNACYIGKIYGLQCFAASSINDFSQCLDVVAHEFTHCVTHSVMTYNSYMNDYGAINEAMSDIQGKNCEMMAGEADIHNWILGSASVTPARSMSDPHAFSQPEFSWDLYYIPNVQNPSPSNDHGGVHCDSSLLNMISYYLIADGGMTLDEARTFWFMTDCSMVPQTDYTQLAELLPWVLKTAGMEQYAGTLEKAIEETRLGEHDMPETIGEDRAVIRMSLPDTEAFDTGNWMMQLTSVKVNELIARATTIIAQVKSGDYSVLPEIVQQLIEEGKEAKEKPAPSIGESAGNLIAALIDKFTGGSGEETEPQTEAPSDEEMRKKVINDVMTWLRDELRGKVFSSYGFAGQDGSTVTMIVKPGRTIPMLQHAKINEASGVPDEVVMAVYIGGKWYGLDVNEIYNMKDSGRSLGLEDLPDGLIENLFGKDFEKLEGIRSLDDALDLITVNIKGGEVTEISANGLDEIVIPEPTPFEEKEWGTLEPGRKSRPKLEEETEAEAAAEEEAA